MSTPVLYTTVESIRATVGLDDNDLSDQMVMDQRLNFVMEERLFNFLPNYEAIYDSSEVGERRLTLWCMYFGALQLIENSVLGIPQKFQANTDQLTRYTPNWEELKSELKRKLSVLEAKLLDRTETSTAFSIMGTSKPGYDPVIG